jgi:cell wall-associated NlpC family hydrolase
MKSVAILLGTLGVVLVSAACASTPGAVPRPFPIPDRRAAAPRPEAPTAENRTPADSPVGNNYPLVATALKLRGAPYRNGGSDPLGFDCSGFTQYVYARYHITLPREVRDQFKVGTAVTLKRIAPGDLLFFSTTDPGPSHVAISLGSDEFVHAPSSTGVVRVERLSAEYWSNRYLGARRIKLP